MKKYENINKANLITQHDLSFFVQIYKHAQYLSVDILTTNYTHHIFTVNLLYHTTRHHHGYL